MSKLIIWLIGFLIWVLIVAADCFHWGWFGILSGFFIYFTAGLQVGTWVTRLAIKYGRD